MAADMLTTRLVYVADPEAGIIEMMRRAKQLGTPADWLVCDKKSCFAGQREIAEEGRQIAGCKIEILIHIKFGKIAAPEGTFGGFSSHPCSKRGLRQCIVSQCSRLMTLEQSPSENDTFLPDLVKLARF